MYNCFYDQNERNNVRILHKHATLYGRSILITKLQVKSIMTTLYEILIDQLREILKISILRFRFRTKAHEEMKSYFKINIPFSEAL